MDVLGDENAINTTRLEVFGLGLGGEKNAGGCGPSRYCCCSSFHDSGDVAFRNGLVHIRATKSFTLERVTVGAPNPSREPIALSFNTLAKTISKLLDLRRQAPTVQEYAPEGAYHHRLSKATFPLQCLKLAAVNTWIVKRLPCRVGQGRKRKHKSSARTGAQTPVW